MKKKHILTRLILCLVMVMLFIPASSITAQAASRKTPSKVTISSVKATGYDRVTVKWKKAKNATAYAIYYKRASAKKWVKLKTVSAKTTSYLHKASKKYPLKQGVKYSYRVRAYNKSSKKYGSYSKTKTVKMPKKVVVTPKPTQKPQPTVTVKPTAAPKPTAIPKPTTIPKPTEAPKPTAVPQPTKAPQPTATPIPKPTAIPKPTETPKPTAAPKPTATPVPTATPRPTATPAPTATPKPVKVSGITLNQTSLTMTSKGQTASLTATVMPDNAENKNVTWSSSNSSVATVNANGTITAVANGTADITATAADGSGVSAKCGVTVSIPNNVRNITLEGGKGKNIGPDRDDFDSIDFKKITFEIKNPTKSVDVLGFNATRYAAGVTIKGLTRGTATIIAKYNENVLLTYNVTVTSDWQEYLEYAAWRHSVESQIWTSNMSLKDKLDAACNYIKTEFSYKLGYCQAVLIYSDKMCDCFGSTEIFGDFAKDAGAQVKYASTYTGQMYDYLADAVSNAGHLFNKVLLNGQWVNYDAQPPLS